MPTPTPPKDHILRLSLGISDHNDDAIDAPWFHRVALHVDRCFPAQDPDSAYDTWWLVLQAVNDLSPLRSEGLTDLPLAPETLASILPSLASQLFAAFPHPGLEAEPLAC
jgi:hypothetical protein